MSENTEKISSDLIRWLKMLALPRWAKFVVAVVMLLTLSSGLGLLIDGIFSRNKDSISMAASILTLVLPIGLIVIALVFGDGGSKKLSEATSLVLNQEIPQAIRENLKHGLLTDSLLTFVTHGYIADYELVAKLNNSALKTLRFGIELNVKKANVVFHIPLRVDHSDARRFLQSYPAYFACVLGAEREGYILNPIAQFSKDTQSTSVVFIKTLHDDFLLEPAQRLYFEQDLAFFVRGMLEAALKDV